MDQELSLEDMTDEQLCMEIADLRAAIETIDLDLLDDANGGYWRDPDWRTRARGARAFKRADLGAANALLKVRRQVKYEADKKERLERRAANKAAEDAARLPSPAKLLKQQTALEYKRAELQRAEEKTERVRIATEAAKHKDRRILQAFRAEYGLDAYMAMVRKAGFDA